MQELLNSEAARYFEIEPYSTILSSIGKGSENARHKKQLVRLTDERESFEESCRTSTETGVLLSFQTKTGIIFRSRKKSLKSMCRRCLNEREAHSTRSNPHGGC